MNQNCNTTNNIGAVPLEKKNGEIFYSMMKLRLNCMEIILKELFYENTPNGVSVFLLRSGLPTDLDEGHSNRRWV